MANHNKQQTAAAPTGPEQQVSIPAQQVAQSPDPKQFQLPPAMLEVATKQKELGDYLRTKGWTPDSYDARTGDSTWNDPKGSAQAPEMVPAVTLPKGKDGGTEIIMQYHCPPVPWAYNTMDAVSIQRSRDAVADQEPIEVAIDRKERELAELKRKAREQAA